MYYRWEELSGIYILIRNEGGKDFPLAVIDHHVGMWRVRYHVREDEGRYDSLDAARAIAIAKVRLR